MQSGLFVTSAVAVVVLAACFVFYRLVGDFTGNLGQRQTNPTSGKPGEPIELHAVYIPFKGGGGTTSPFTTKVEAYLRMAGLQYQTKPSDLKSSPNGRIPWMKYGTQRIADSRFIIRFLQNTYGSQLKDLREPSDAHGKALSTTIQRLCEQHMYFTNLYHGAATPQGRKAAPKMFAGLMPWPLNYVAARAWWQGRTTQLRYQGMLTNSHEDINALIAEDFAALSALLGDKKFFLGSQPSAADCCVFGFIEAHTHGPGGTPLAAAARKHSNLVSFVDHIQKTYFADRLEKGFKLD